MSWPRRPRVMRKVPRPFDSHIARHFSSSASAIGSRPSAPPALLTRTRQLGTWPQKLSTEEASVTSRGSARAPESSAATASSRSRRRAPRTTSKPAAASPRAVAAPLPLDAPVTTAVPNMVPSLPFELMSTTMLSTVLGQGEVTRKSRASEVDPGGLGPWERDGLAVVEGNDEHGGGEQVPDPTQQPGSGRGIEALGRFVEQEDVGPSEESLRYAEAPALAAGEGQSAGANWRFEPERERRDDIEGGRRQC